MIALQFRFPIIILLVMMVVNCKRKASIVQFNMFNSTFKPTFLKSCETTIPPEFKGQAFSVDAVLIRNITTNLYARIGVFLQNKMTNSFDKAFEYDFDVCRLWDGFMSQAIGRVWYKNLKKFGNFPAECPVVQGHYYLKNMKIDKNSVPPFMLDGVYRTTTKLIIKKDDEEEEVFDSLLELEVKRN